ncbi:MAG: hypothetical protein QM734_04715 [Cyclobacteriaceae bacterium]
MVKNKEQRETRAKENLIKVIHLPFTHDRHVLRMGIATTYIAEKPAY